MVLHEVCPLSEVAVPAKHPSGMELLQEPLMGTIHVPILIPAGKCALKAFHSVVVFVGAKYACVTQIPEILRHPSGVVTSLLPAIGTINPFVTFSSIHHGRVAA